jgi:DmsE family decaheme c-type cytochrome
MKTVTFTAILLISLCIAASFAADYKLRQTGSALCFSCHEEEKSAFSKKYVHSPIEQDNCTACHNPHTAKYQFMLSEKQPDLCYSCHEEEKGKFSQAAHVHTAVKQGKCTGCHDPHASDNQHLQKATDQDLCYSCHKQEAEDFAKGEIHLPVEAGECLTCHKPHVSDFQSLLVDSPEPLCFTCHDQQDEELKRAHSQYPIAKSNCLSCHAAHASDVKDPDLAALAKGLPLPYIHKPFGKKMCDSCHQSSVAPEPLKLRAEQVEICYRCHSDMKTAVNSQPHIHMLYNMVLIQTVVVWRC